MYDPIDSFIFLANLLESFTQVSFRFINGPSSPGSNNSQFRYSYCLYVCACMRICVFQKLYTDLKTIVFHFCFSRGFNNSNFNCSMVLAASLQHIAESTCAFGLLPSAAETTIGHQWWPGGHWYRSVSYTSTGRSPGGHWYWSVSYILQRVSGHWSPLVQIATDVGSRWEKSEFRL